MSHFQTKYIICILANDTGFLKAEVGTRQWVVTSKLMTSALHFYLCCYLWTLCQIWS